MALFFLPLEANEASGHPFRALQPELRIADAELAIVVSLRQGIFLRAAAERPASSADKETAAILSGERLDQLLRWLLMLAALFPVERARKDLRILRTRVHDAAAAGGLRLSLESILI